MLIAAKQGADLNETDIRNEVDTFMFEVNNIIFYYERIVVMNVLIHSGS